eukprot:TRINITY_DN23266_c0_g2_i1.p1 TRINITY_DN23266_c0_g2~~TRINITY_DN23266_c0_g2_i1.p1  ORF type:complete len:637 (+),score=26.93 TRINITY_DN23266_c0_g2_i1:65-1975(+)
MDPHCAPPSLATATILEGRQQQRGLGEDMIDAFRFMDRRRQLRQVHGKAVARNMLGIVVEVAMFLGFGLIGLAKLRTKIFGLPQQNVQYLAVPMLLTVGIIVASLRRSIVHRENLALLWGKSWAYLLVVWSLWVYDPQNVCPSEPDPQWSLFGTSVEEMIVFTVFVTLEILTLLCWLLVQRAYPFLTQLCPANFLVRWFWRIRPSVRRLGYSYYPNGMFCNLHRRHFNYHGGTDDDGRPHGPGVWQDDSYHGEVFDGHWQHGLPVAPFVSRTFGSGAISYGWQIGYGTARAENLTGLQFMPQRREDGFLRFGVVGVECSAANGFLAHLPQLVEGSHFERSSAADVISDLRMASDAVLCRSGASGPSQIVESGRGSGITALVFVHGYNCPVDWACMRLGQLLTLGKFSPNVLPFVFSWPTGTVFSFDMVKRMLPTFAPDLIKFLNELMLGGVSEVHIIAHSMGCELVSVALPGLEELVRTRDNLRNGTNDKKHWIASLSFCNASSPAPEFLADYPVLETVLNVCGRWTLYNDRDDTALWFADTTHGGIKSLGRHTDPIAERQDFRDRIDVIDCTMMDANVSGIRHSYFDLNSHVIGDLQELISSGLPAYRRSRLVRTSPDPTSNVFAFLAPPVFVNW